MTSQTTSQLATNLARLLAERGISENALARAIGVPQPTINRIVKGESQEPRVGTLIAIAAYFDVDPLSLLSDGEVARSVERDLELYPQLLQHLEATMDDAAGNEGLAPGATSTPMVYRPAWQHRFGAKPGDAVSMRVRGAAMERTLFDGDLVAVHFTGVAPVVPDTVYAVMLDGVAAVRRLFRHGQGLRVACDNPDKGRYPDECMDAAATKQRVRLLGRVIERCGSGGL